MPYGRLQFTVIAVKLVVGNVRGLNKSGQLGCRWRVARPHSEGFCILQGRMLELLVGRGYINLIFLSLPLTSIWKDSSCRGQHTSCRGQHTYPKALIVFRLGQLRRPATT